MSSLRPSSVAEVQAAVQSQQRILPVGGGSKPALSTPHQGQTGLEMRGLSGVLEYDPSEYVFVAKAGTPLLEVEQMLAQHGQYLPFDPPLTEAGATLGGTVAAGLSGPMRHRYGGVRDFILGVQLVDGLGQVIRGGGKVVKNAAGFDLPKLMVGSLGQLGILTELAFKVFPAPKATLTLKVSYSSLGEALEALYKLAGSSFELYALDLEAPPAPTLVLRIGGFETALPQRLERLLNFLGVQPGDRTLVLQGELEAEHWRFRRRLELGQNPPGVAWPGLLVKVAIQPKLIPQLEAALNPLTLMRQYLSAGNLLYFSCAPLSHDLDQLGSALKSLGLAGLVLSGPVNQARLGLDLDHPFAQKVRLSLDPQGKFTQTYATHH